MKNSNLYFLKLHFTLKLIIRANSPITQPGADGDLRL